MDKIDLNLLPALDALLTEGSVTGAACRLGISASAMSRTLARLRTLTADPLLVRAGRHLTLTPRALTLRDQVHELTRATRTILSPLVGQLELATLNRTFSIRANEGFIALFAAHIVEAVIEAAPLVRLLFANKDVKSSEPLRAGKVDLEIGVIGTFAPEVRTRLLFRDHFLGVVREGHPLLDGPVTAERYAACKHVGVSRRGIFTGPVDDALGALGLRREVVVVMPGFPDALRIARHSDLVALVPFSCLSGDLGSREPSIEGLVSFGLPVQAPDLRISAMWHPRDEADLAHRWFRDIILTVCRTNAARLSGHPAFSLYTPDGQIQHAEKIEVLNL